MACLKFKDSDLEAVFKAAHDYMNKHGLRFFSREEVLRDAGVKGVSAENAFDELVISRYIVIYIREIKDGHRVEPYHEYEFNEWRA